MSAHDPWIYVACATVPVVVGIAAQAPAVARALSVDPCETLRAE